MQNLQNPILTFFITFPSRFTSKPQIHQPPATKLLVFTHITIIEPGCENEEDDGVWRVIGEEAEWFPLSLSLSLTLFANLQCNTPLTLAPSILSAFVETESMDSLPNSFNPNKRLKEEFVFLSHPLSFFILYMPSSHFFLLLLIWVFQIRDQFDWVFHARSLCPFNYSLCKSHILFLIHIFLCPFSFFSYCSYCSHRFSLFFATHFPPIAISVMPTLCYLVL